MVVIIGILAAIAIPKFSATREKAYFAAMKSDLKNLASQQEIYYADAYAYTNSTTGLGFVSSEGVNVAITAGTDGWSASNTHSALSTMRAVQSITGRALLRRPPSPRRLRVRWPARNKADRVGFRRHWIAFGWRAWLGSSGPRSLTSGLRAWC